MKHKAACSPYIREPAKDCQTAEPDADLKS
jgi:hypothetical protein